MFPVYPYEYRVVGDVTRSTRVREPLVLVVSPLSHCIPVPPTYYRPVAHLYATHLSAQPIIVRLRTFTPPVYVPLIIARLRTFTQPTCLHNLLSSGCAHLRHLFMYHLLSPGCAHLRNPLVCTTYYRPVAHIYATCLCLSIIARLRTFTQPTCLHNLLSSGCAHLRHLFMFVYYRPVASNYATFFTLKFY